MTKRGENIKFILKFIGENPGCKPRDAWKALLISKGLDPSDRSNRGRFVSYFYTNRQKQWTIVGNQMWLANVID